MSRRSKLSPADGLSTADYARLTQVERLLSKQETRLEEYEAVEGIEGPKGKTGPEGPLGP